jgi:predicted transcriptional regulator
LIYLGFEYIIPACSGEDPNLNIDDIENSIINYIKNNKTASTEEISKFLGLSLPTIHNNINKLLNQGIITKTINNKKTFWTIR